MEDLIRLKSSRTLLEGVRELLSSDGSCYQDAVVICGETRKVIKCSSLLLAAGSPYLRELLASLPEHQSGETSVGTSPNFRHLVADLQVKIMKIPSRVQQIIDQSERPQNFSGPNKIGSEAYEAEGQRPRACRRLKRRPGLPDQKFEKDKHGMKSEMRVLEHVCYICARSFAAPNSLNSHLRNVHRPECEQLACVRCRKKFNTARGLAVHAALHEEPQLACPHCPKKLHTSLYLKGHILRNHTSWQDLPYRCDTCQRGFADRDTYEGHSNMHAGLRPHRCRYCPKAYQNPSNRTAHEKHNHPEQYTKVRRGLAGVRVKKRELGEVAVSEEDLNIHSYQFNWR